MCFDDFMSKITNVRRVMGIHSQKQIDTRLLEKISALTVGIGGLSDVPELLQSIARSNLPARDIFDFLITHGIKGGYLAQVLVGDYQKDLNKFCDAVSVLMLAYDDSTDSREIRQKLYVMSRTKTEPKIVKSTEQLAQELLDVL